MKILVPMIASLALAGCAAIQTFDARVSTGIIAAEASTNRKLLAVNTALAKKSSSVARLAADCLVAESYVEALASVLAPSAVSKAQSVKAICGYYAANPTITVARAARDLATALTAAQMLAQKPVGR